MREGKEGGLVDRGRAFVENSPAAAAGAGATVGIGVFWLASQTRSRLRRIKTAANILPGAFEKRRWIKGVVTSVGDADGFRIYHTPFPSFLRGPPKNKRITASSTISIRLAGVDAPEMAHFGAPGQPFAVEAQDHLKKLVEGRRVWVQLLKRDRYERCVGAALYPSWIFFWRSVQQELSRRGLAVVYEGSDAVYGDKDPKEKLDKIVAKAKSKRLGMWSLKGGDYQSPAQYKKAHG